MITIEDAAELQLNHIENLVRMETRMPMRKEPGHRDRGADPGGPSYAAGRLIIGEVRGKEALDLLQSLNTGHDGGFSSGHANSVEGLLSGLETMVLMAADSAASGDPESDRVGGGHYGAWARMRDKTRK